MLSCEVTVQIACPTALGARQLADQRSPPAAREEFLGRGEFSTPIVVAALFCLRSACRPAGHVLCFVEVMLLRSIRPDRGERLGRLPGDELIADPIASMTHAITIQRGPHDVWPWLAQMGAGARGGWYSYDWLDNRRWPSADRIVPALQSVTVGTLFPALPGETRGFHVLACEPFHSLVIGWRGTPDAAPIMTWAFVLQSLPANRTRLMVRARGSHDYPFYGLPRFIGQPLIRFVHFVMERKQLHGIATRVESHHPTISDQK